MSTSAAQPSLDSTIKNLLTAFNGESNAHVRYAAFARKADEEGYHQAASLFRAASRAEQIHATSHAAVIRKLGGSPDATIEVPEVKSTRENLQTALAGEEYERDVMYPQFIREAEAQQQTAALRTFRNALAAEAEHARLYTAAIANLQNLRVKASYYVCPVCGYTADQLTFERCPVCNVPGEKFEAIS
jgi:rubrerythrin